MTGRGDVRPHTHTVPHLLTEDRVTLHPHTPTQFNTHEYLALARVSCNVSHLILGVSERRPREREREREVEEKDRSVAARITAFLTRLLYAQPQNDAST